MSEYTVVGDQHIKNPTLDQGKELFALVEAIGRPAIWLGDLLDTKEVIRGKCLNAAIDYFANSKLRHYVLVGNHDWFNLDCQSHSLKALELLENVIVVDRPMITDGMAFFPYIHDRAKLQAAIDEFQGPDRVLFAHLEVDQFDFGNGHVCTTGIPLSALSGFRRVISGHFHKFQESGNLTFLGTPYTQSQGEANQKKYLGLYDQASDTLRTAETDFPRHITVEVDCDKVDEKTTHPVFQVEEKGWERHHYRVILTGTEANIARFPMHLYERFDTKWLTRPSDFAENSVCIDETASNEAQFVKWATEIKKMSPETIQLGLSILGACR